MTERLPTEKRGAVGWITFNNPERRNAMSLDMWEALPRALDAFEADDEVRVIALRGAGDKAFISGADISQFEKDRSSPEGVQRYEEMAEGAQQRLSRADKPTVAVIRGYCLGGGVNIALACDLRLAADDARFGIPAARMGIGYRASSTKNLVDVVGPAYAREILITARQFSAAEALAMGLVQRVVPALELDARADALLAEIGVNSPLSMRTGKRIVRELLKPAAAFDAEAARGWVRECFSSEDYREGRQAFMEKRKPVFKGK